MVIWRGPGVFVAAGLFVAAFAAVYFLAEAVGGRDTSAARSNLVAGTALILAGIGTFAFGRWYFERTERNPYSARDTSAPNDVFFIPIVVWGVIGVIAGVVFVLLSLGSQP